MQILSSGQCAGLISYVFSEEKHTGWINNFYVSPERRNAGVGSKAYRLAGAHLASLGAEQIELVPVANAQPFYLQLGFASSRINAEGEQVFSKWIA